MYWKLKDSPVEVPPSTFNFLRSTYYQTLAQNTLMYQELERILKALDRAGIEVIVLKGAALAATVYADIGLRPMGDLDLLVKDEQLPRALEVILSMGYVEEPIPHEEFNRQIGYDVHLWRESNHNLKVEVHWGLITGGYVWFGPTMGWVWEQAEDWYPNVKSLHNNCLVLSFESSLLYLSAHLMLQHGIEQARLVWFFDLHQLISQSEKEEGWDRLVEQFWENRWLPALRATLTQVQLLFDTALPDGILANFSRRETDCPEFNGLFRHRVSRIRTKAADVWELSSLLKPSEKIKFVITMVVPSPRYIRWRYNPKPAWLWPLYYPYRWMRMVRESISTISKLLFPI
jgi:hypothetical protein